MVLVLCTHKQSAHKCRDWIISEEKYIQDGEEEDEDAVLELPHKRVMLLSGSLPCTCCATATEFFLLHLLLLFASPDRIAQEHRVARLLSSFCFVFFFSFFFNLLLLIFFLRALFVKLKRDDWGQKTRQLFFFLTAFTPFLRFSLSILYSVAPFPSYSSAYSTLQDVLYVKWSHTREISWEETLGLNNKDKERRGEKR